MWYFLIPSWKKTSLQSVAIYPKFPTLIKEKKKERKKKEEERKKEDKRKIIQNHDKRVLANARAKLTRKKTFIEWVNVGNLV